MTKFPERLYELLKENNIKTKDVAVELGVLPRTVLYWLEGKRECDFATLIALARYLGVSTDYLLGKEDY